MIGSSGANQNGIGMTEALLPALLDVFRAFRRVLILTHDNPDPDAIASALGLKYLARRGAGNPARVAYGGVIGRPENRALINLLGVQVTPLSRIRWQDVDALALVDHQPGRGWRSPAPGLPVVAVIDHHPRIRWRVTSRFSDVRRGYGANSTMITQYLQASGLPLPRFLATALLYGVLSDTQEFSRGVTQADLEAHSFLFRLCDHEKIYAIRHPVVAPEYLSDYWQGIRRSRRFRDIAVTYMGAVTTPEITAEVADRLVTVQGIRWSLVSAYFERTLFLSVRHRGGRKDAGRLIRSVVGRRGNAGGHGFMAGAQLRDISPDRVETVAWQMILRFLAHLHPDAPDTDDLEYLLAGAED